MKLFRAIVALFDKFYIPQPLAIYGKYVYYCGSTLTLVRQYGTIKHREQERYHDYGRNSLYTGGSC